MAPISGNERKIIIAAAIICLFLITGLLARKITGKQNGKTIEASGRIEVRGFDWGPAITKAVIQLSQDPDKGQTLSADMFQVKEKKKGNRSAVSSQRTVADVYFSDENGNRADPADTENGTSFITLELQYSPEEGSPFYYDPSSFNYWYKSYSMEIQLRKGKTLLLSNKEETGLETVKISFADKPNESVILPETENVYTSGSFTGKDGNTLTYASFVPDNASEDNKRPLVIWLHGAGEGGTDPLITLYGNKVTALFGKEFQNTMNGAYVLVPQTPAIWKLNENGEYFSDQYPGERSFFLHDLKELIDEFAGSNHVDKNRIIVGGCSNGGFMTMDLILHYPDYFAAAYPICEMYEPELIPDEKLEGIKSLPMWFVYARNDNTVVPSVYEEPLLQRLKQLGAGQDLHVSEFADVHDTSGLYYKDSEPYPYYGHFSWIYFFNNECFDGDLSLWQWLSEQKLD